MWVTLTAAMILAGASQAASRPTTERPRTTDAVELLPAPGRAVITGDPAEASRDLMIRYITPEGEVSGRSTSVRAGDVIELSGGHHPGPHRLVVNGEACSGSFPIEGDRQTAVIRITRSGCETLAADVGPAPTG